MQCHYIIMSSVPDWWEEDRGGTKTVCCCSVVVCNLAVPSITVTHYYSKAISLYLAAFILLKL